MASHSASGPDRDWPAIHLSSLEQSDTDALHTWQNTPGVRDLTMGFRFPVQKDAVRDWLAEIRRDNGRSRVVFAVRRGEALLGTVQLNQIDALHRTASFGIFIGDSAHRGAGVGYAAGALILDYAFNGLDLRRVELEVLSSNAPGRRLFERLGFVEEGTRRERYFLDGRYEDVSVYGLLQREFALSLPQQAKRLIHARPPA